MFLLTFYIIYLHLGHIACSYFEVRTPHFLFRSVSLTQAQKVRLVKVFVVPRYVIFLVKLVGDHTPLLFAPGKLNLTGRKDLKHSGVSPSFLVMVCHTGSTHGS